MYGCIPDDAWDGRASQCNEYGRRVTTEQAIGPRRPADALLRRHRGRAENRTRDVDCTYDPVIFALLAKLHDERGELCPRGQYNIRDTFISLALSAGKDPGWVAAVCGTSGEMIFRTTFGVISRGNPPPTRPQGRKRTPKCSEIGYLRVAEAGNRTPSERPRWGIPP